MTHEPRPIRYFIPGPVWIDPRVAQAMTRPVLPHRSDEFKELWVSVGERLRPVFRTRQDVLIATSSASMVLEAALVSIAPERVLSVTNGAFSERWRDIARLRGLTTDELAAPWGSAVDPDELRQRVRALRPDVVTMVHCETSTGVLNPIEELAAAVRDESDALVLVDTVSALAGTPVEPEGWGLDVVVTASQKAMALPPGLAFFTVSDRAWSRIERTELRGFYTDFVRYRRANGLKGPITTPALQLVYALDAQLDRMVLEGIEARWQRHRELLEQTRAWASARGFEYASEGRSTSPTVSCLRSNSNVSAPDLVKKLAEHGYVVGGGYGQFKDDTFRIGHMGEIAEEDLTGLFEIVDSVIEGT